MIFHTDRRNEFDNRIIDNFLEGHSVIRSMKRKETPYDNAVSESTFKIVKTELSGKRHSVILNNSDLSIVIMYTGSIITGLIVR